MAQEEVLLSVEDGTRMKAYAARPTVQARTPRGIIIFQEAFGVNDHIKDVARRFADAGFTAIAPELYHRTTTEAFDYADGVRPRPHADAVTVETIGPDARAAYSWLSEEARVGKEIVAIGYCMGGRVAFTANALLPLRAAISYYGNIPPAAMPLAADQQAPIMMVWAGRDHHIPAERQRAVREALTHAGKEHLQIVFSNADHGFFCDARPESFEAEASRLIWPMTLDFLRIKLGD